jgi:hypothetical protein
VDSVEIEKAGPPPQAVKKSATLHADLEGKTLAAWAAAFAAGRESGDPPLPPAVPLQLAFANPSDEALTVQVGGDDFVCRLDLAGGRVRRLAAPNAPLPVKKRAQALAAGGKLVLSWDRLISVEEGQVEYLYPLTPGEYKLTVTVRVRAWAPGGKSRDVWLRPAGPVTVRVGR